jgi:DNA processing protein
MQREELAAWLRLTLTEGVGNDSARSLLAAFGLPRKRYFGKHLPRWQMLSV